MEIISQNKTQTNTYEVEFSVPAAEVDAACNAAYAKNKNRFNVPGFRKGKATRKMIENLYGEGVFFDEAANTLYSANVEDVVEKTGLEVVDVKPELSKMDLTDGAVFKLVITVKPEVTVTDYKGLEITKIVKTVNDEAVMAELDKMRARNGVVSPVEGRAAQMGDTAVIDFEGFLDGVAFDGGKGEAFPLELGSGQFIPGFEEQIVGKNVGEEFDVNVTFPEGYQAQDLAGKPAVFKCKVLEIKEKILPELDDEFAQEVDNEVDTLDQLKEKVKADLEKKAEDEMSNQTDNALIDALLTKFEAEVPEAMYTQRENEIIRDWSARSGLKVEDYLKYTGLTIDQFRANFSEVAKRQVDLRLALEKIAELENIEVTDEDIEKEYADMAEMYKMEIDKVKSAIPADAIKNDVRIEKALNLVRDNANISETSEVSE